LQAATAAVTAALIQVSQAAQVTQALRILEGTYQASNGWLNNSKIFYYFQIIFLISPPGL
jgi:hypothetical protein